MGVTILSVLKIFLALECAAMAVLAVFLVMGWFRGHRPFPARLLQAAILLLGAGMILLVLP